MGEGWVFAWMGRMEGMVVGVCGTAIDRAGVEWWEQSEELWRVEKENWDVQTNGRR